MKQTRKYCSLHWKGGVKQYTTSLWYSTYFYRNVIVRSTAYPNVSLISPSLTYWINSRCDHRLSFPNTESKLFWFKKRRNGIFLFNLVWNLSTKMHITFFFHFELYYLPIDNGFIAFNFAIRKLIILNCNCIVLFNKGPMLSFLQEKITTEIGITFLNFFYTFHCF